MRISLSTIERICRIFGFLRVLKQQGAEFVSSRQLAKGIGVAGYTVRKDLSLLGVADYTRKGYDVAGLMTELGSKLALDKKRKACIVGLGRLGTAILDYGRFPADGFDIVAGFDRSINKIERLRTEIDIFPVSELEQVVVQRGIELGIIAVPAEAAETIAQRLVEAGVKGILNFSPARLNLPEEIIYQDMDFTGAMRFIVARMYNQGGAYGQGV